MSKKHEHTPEYIKALITNPSQYRTTRKINIRNAIVHDLHLKAQERGEKMTLKDLNALADSVILEPRSKQEEARLKNQLETKRKLDRVGLRGNNLSAAADARAVANRIQDKLMNLFERTGTRGVLLLSRGHVDDHFMPTYTESGGSLNFFLQHLPLPYIVTY
ncbi:hypothetical protein FB451DRAFT_319632 [Mycena latifolia]|nr:hypothetical protein FB451DRAFT_319632 [Mycena latifolia]